MYKNIATQKLKNPLFKSRGIEASILRLDLIHPQISGNKWFKLKYHLEEAVAMEKKGIVSFGGAFSNHLVALSFACREQGLRSAGFIRGEEPLQYGSSLKQMKEADMELLFVSREEYSHKEKLEEMFLAAHPDFYCVPEGGQSEMGIKGAAEIGNLCNGYSHIVCAVGTGTTITGIINGTDKSQKVIGISALKVSNKYNNTLLDFIQQYALHDNYELNFEYHFGGYAKKTGALISFMNDFYMSEKIKTDFVYTGKLLYAFNDLAMHDFFPKGASVMIIHSGGLQGNLSLGNQTLSYI